MAWTRKLPSGKYQGRYRNLNNDVRSAGTFTQEKQAQKEAERVESEQRQPGAVNLDGGKIRWGDWFDSWHEARIVAYSTDENYRSTVENHIRPHWGNTKLADIEPIGVSRWVKQLSKDGASPYTIRNAVTLFKGSLNAAVNANRLVRNPATGVRLPDMPDAVERFLTRDEVEVITFYLDGLNALIVWTAVQTGMRFGEIAGLHWSRVDLDRGVIQVVEKFDQKAKRIDPVPKDKEKRTVPLPPELVTKLRRHRDGAAPARTCGLRHTAGRCTGDLVFRGPRGAAIQSAAWGVGPWARSLKLAGIEDRVRPHDLRHTYASWLIQDGVPLADIAPVMGHSDIEMSRRYAHLSDEDSHAKVRNAISRASARRPASGPSEIAAAVQQHTADTVADADSEAAVSHEPPRVAQRVAESDYPGLRLVTGDDPKTAS